MQSWICWTSHTVIGVSTHTVLQVKAAFQALGTIQAWEDLAKVDDTHANFEEGLYQAIFVSHEAEAMLLEALPLSTGMMLWYLNLRSTA